MAVLSDLELATAPHRATGRKAHGLAQLVAHGVATPAFVVLDDGELAAWSAQRRLSAAVRSGLAALIDRTTRAGAPAVFSVRCEGTSATNAARPPPSILNVGLTELAAGPRPPHPAPATLRATYDERVALFEQRHGPARIPRGDLLATLCAWIARMFEAIAAGGALASHNLVVQRMVFGCADARSGNGICCNLPDASPDGRFRGVFLPGQQGIPAIRGVWGEPQVDLRALETINPDAYHALARIFDRLEAVAPDPYLEFTVEGSALYCMQYEQRRRRVVVA
jgi:hypothetical protein